MTLAFEPEHNNVVADATAGRRLLDELRSARLRVVIDAANLSPARRRSGRRQRDDADRGVRAARRRARARPRQGRPRRRHDGGRRAAEGSTTTPVRAAPRRGRLRRAARLARPGRVRGARQHRLPHFVFLIASKALRSSKCMKSLASVLSISHVQPPASRVSTRGHPRRMLSGAVCRWSPDFVARSLSAVAGAAVRPTDALRMGAPARRVKR